MTLRMVRQQSFISYVVIPDIFNRESIFIFQSCIQLPSPLKGLFRIGMNGWGEGKSFMSK